MDDDEDDDFISHLLNFWFGIRIVLAVVTFSHAHNIGSRDSFVPRISVY